ncbi:MAG: glycosyltransferase family 4 protein [Candidatus Neomarinimicrobiota bacterium]
MVTGVYYPEVSGGSFQCRQLINLLADRVKFSVVTTTNNPQITKRDQVDGVSVYRFYVEIGKIWSLLNATFRLILLFLRLQRGFDIVHFHGFSRKSMLFMALAKLFGKKSIIKLSSAGHDDPLAMQGRSRIIYWFYSLADCFVGPSPRFEKLYNSSSLQHERFRLIPNGVNLEKFQPTEKKQQQELKQELKLPTGLLLILFVGHFSAEKSPNSLFDAWKERIAEELPVTGLVFVGATRSDHYEVDQELVEQIQREVQYHKLRQRIVFVERTYEIEKYYQSADIFVLPTIREGLPNALLEAMATGLPCIASRLEGITEGLLVHGVNGLLFPPGDVAALEENLARVLKDSSLARRLGSEARKTIEDRYSIEQVASEYLEVYNSMLAT